MDCPECGYGLKYLLDERGSQVKKVYICPECGYEKIIDKEEKR